MAFAKDDPELAKENPFIEIKYQDKTGLIIDGDGDFEYYKILVKSVPTIVVAEKERKNVVPALGNNPTCRNIRDSIIQLCSRKLDQKKITSQYFQVDPKIISKAKDDLELARKRFLVALDEVKQTDQVANKSSLKVDSAESSKFIKKCYDKINNYDSRVAILRGYFDFKKDKNKLKGVPQNCIDRFIEVSELSKNLSHAHANKLKNIEKLNDQKRILQDLEAIVGGQNAGIDIINFGKDSPCESLRIDYDVEGNLSNLTINKRQNDSKDKISYVIKIKNEEDVENKEVKKDSVSCEPNVERIMNGGTLSPTSNTEFEKELSSILKRNQDALFTPNNRRAPQNPEATGRSKQ